MATLGSLFAGSYLAASGGEKPKTAQGPPINASSKDEENFVQYVPHHRREPRTVDHQSDLNISLERVTDYVSHRNFMKEVDGGEKKPAAGH